MHTLNSLPKHTETQYETKEAIKKAIVERLLLLFPGSSVIISSAQMVTDVLEPFAVQVKLTYTAQITPKDTTPNEKTSLDV